MIPTPYRYRSLAAALTAELSAGHYPPGTRLPSVRQLCAQHGASLATVTHALHALEDAGLIEARPRRGFFARAPLRPDTTALPAAKAIALAGRRKRVMELADTPAGCVSLGHLALPASLLPLRTLQRLLNQQLRANLGALATGTVVGTEALRKQLALRAPRLGCHFAAEDIVLTQGEGESLEICLRLLAKPGELIAIASPAPLRALEVIASLDLRVLEIPAPVETGLSVPALAFALQHHTIAACVVEPNFDRSTGSLMHDADKQALAALLEQHQLPLIECDMMGELHRGAHRPRPVKAFDRHDWVLYCGSFTSITGPGLGLGYIVSGRHRLQLRAARAVHGELLPTLTDQMLASFMASDGFDPHLRRLRLRLAERLAEYREAAQAAFPPGTRIHSSAGGYVLWLELPAGLNACTLLEQARRAGYTFVAGAAFSNGKQFDHCLRLTAAHPLDETRARGLRLLGELARRLRPEATPAKRS